MTLTVVVTVTMGMTMLVTLALTLAETVTMIVKMRCLKMTIWVTGVLRRTVVGDWRFDNLCVKAVETWKRTLETLARLSKRQDSSYSDDHFQSRYVTPWFKSFSYILSFVNASSRSKVDDTTWGYKLKDKIYCNIFFLKLPKVYVTYH